MAMLTGPTAIPSRQASETVVQGARRPWKTPQVFHLYAAESEGNVNNGGDGNSLIS